MRHWATLNWNCFSFRQLQSHGGRSQSQLLLTLRGKPELGITNIQYLQADILNLDELGQEFDIIESAGVLHHMNEPMVGWRILADALKTGD